MAVGTRFMDPDTQAAIAAQGGTVQPDAAAEAAQAAEAAAKVKADEAAAQAAKASPDNKQGTDENADKATQTPTDLDMGSIPKKQSQEEIDAALATAGFSNEALGKELADNKGTLTAATITALKGKFDSAAVDQTVKDMQEQWAKEFPAAEASVATAHKQVADMNTYIFETLAGGDATKGQEHMATLSDWAKANMTADELSTINTLLRSGEKAVVKRGLDMAVTQWKKGQETPMMTGDATAISNATQAPAFAPLSKDQFIEIMKTEKYNTDAEYKEQVHAQRRKTMETEGMITPEWSILRPPI